MIIHPYFTDKILALAQERILNRIIIAWMKGVLFANIFPPLNYSKAIIVELSFLKSVASVH